MVTVSALRNTKSAKEETQKAQTESGFFLCASWVSSFALFVFPKF
jgi:hypothetical protein